MSHCTSNAACIIMVNCKTLKENIFKMKFYIFTCKCVNKCNFNSLLCILPETISRGLGTNGLQNNKLTNSKTVITVLITTVLEILDSVKDFYLPNGSAPHTECVIKRNNRRLCSSRFETESIVNKNHF